MLSALAASCLLAAAAGAAAPRPPCAAPAGMIPAVPESMCSTEVVPANAAGVSVRSYGVPTSERLVTDLTPPNFPYDEVVNISISNFIVYFKGANSAKADIFADRTVPVTVRSPTAAGDGWRVSMMVSTAAFPLPLLVPTPNNFEMSIEEVGERLFATLPFNTSAVPSEAQFKAACLELALHVPAGYAIVSEGWTPTYVIYGGRDAPLFTNECWVQVNATRR
jgi:hypothetical protein